MPSGVVVDLALGTCEVLGVPLADDDDNGQFTVTHDCTIALAIEIAVLCKSDHGSLDRDVKQSRTCAGLRLCARAMVLLSTVAGRDDVASSIEPELVALHI
jgi:hypothetical protein